MFIVLLLSRGAEAGRVEAGAVEGAEVGWHATGGRGHGLCVVRGVWRSNARGQGQRRGMPSAIHNSTRLEMRSALARAAAAAWAVARSVEV